MRRALTFGPGLAGTLDEAPGRVGLLIVTGGTQTRVGPHRSQALLAARIARAGHPVFRYDRAGVGDSAGVDKGYRESLVDLIAAIDEFYLQTQNLDKIILYGLCDAATGLALHWGHVEAAGLILANPWVHQPNDDLPPPAAIRRHYRQRLFSLHAWRRLLRGEINLDRAAKGLRAAGHRSEGMLATEIRKALGSCPLPVTILLSNADATAIAFDAAAIADPSRHHIAHRETASHSFATTADRAWLTDQVIAALRRA